MRALLLAVALTSLLPAQDVLHYRFESGGGDTVVNLAGDSGIAPATGRILGQGSHDPWGSGRFGGGFEPPQNALDQVLVDTDWDGVFRGEFTMSLFVRRRANGDEYVVWAGNDGMRLSFTDRSNARSYFRLIAAEPIAFFNTDVDALAQRDWVHIAVVGRNLIGRSEIELYVDGNLDATRSISNGFRTVVDPEWNLRVGGAFLSSSYAVDEFRFLLRAISPAEVRDWSGRPAAADAAYGAGCGGIANRGGYLTRAATDQLPTPGNAQYGWRLQGFPNSIYSILVGTHRASFQGQPLPFDLAAIDPSFAGCLLDTAADVTTLTGTLDVAGNDTIPVPVPADPSFEGLSLFAQAALLHTPSTTFMLSNGFAVSIGR